MRDVTQEPVCYQGEPTIKANKMPTDKGLPRPRPRHSTTTYEFNNEKRDYTLLTRRKQWCEQLDCTRCTKDS